MKKPFSREQALLLQRNGEKRLERGLRRKQREFSRVPLAPAHDDYKDWRQIYLPDDFTLTGNYAKVNRAISHLRNSANQRRYINFNAIRRVDAAAALMLAAELEVGKISTKTKKMQAHDSAWHPKIRNLFEQMGFMELLSADTEIHQSSDISEGEMFVKFMSGVDMQQEVANKIFRKIQKSFVLGKIDNELGNPMYAGMTEAIINTWHHGYKRINDRQSELKRWWVSASVNSRTRKISVVCYDRGLTIAKTIRDSEPKMRKILSRFTDPDHKIMHTALEKGWTSTGDPNRGSGLPELVDLIDNNRQGTLTIYSGEGMVRYSGGKNPSDSYFSAPLPRRMRGTLVEWSIIPRMVNHKEDAQ